MFAAQLQSMIESGVSLVVGTVSPDGEPRVTRAWSAVVDPTGSRVRVAVGADDPVTVANLASGVVSITGANVRNLHSLQMKGRITSVEVPTADDLAVMRAQTERFFDAIHETDGNPIELLRRFLPHDLVMVDLAVEECYDQTPGPEAGAPLGAR